MNAAPFNSHGRAAPERPAAAPRRGRRIDGVRCGSLRPSLLCSVAVMLLAAPLLRAAPHAATVILTDDTGRRVTVPPPPQRIASLAPSATAMLFAAGAGPQIVATSSFSNEPPAARRIPRIGDANAIDLERIVALRPSVIVAWPGGENPAELDRLGRLGIPVYREQVTTLAGLAASVRRLGVLAGTRAAADDAAERLDSQLAALARRYSGRKPVSVLLQVWSRPLYTIGGAHLLSDALRICGARNLFGDLRQASPAVSTEAVVARDPDIIVAVAPREQSESWLAAWRRFPQMRAVADGNLVAFADQRLTRLGPSTLDATEELCGDIDAARRRLR